MIFGLRRRDAGLSPDRRRGRGRGGNVTTGGPPGLVISATLVQDVALIVAALFFASMWARGLTPASFGFTRVASGRPSAGPARLRRFWILTTVHLARRRARPAGAHARPARGGVAVGADRLRRAAGVRRAARRGGVLPRLRVRGAAREDRGGLGRGRNRARVRPRARRRLADRDRRGADHPRHAAVRALRADGLAAALHRPARDQQLDLLRRDKSLPWTAGVAIVLASTSPRSRSPRPSRTGPRCSVVPRERLQV